MQISSTNVNEVDRRYCEKKKKIKKILKCKMFKI